MQQSVSPIPHNRHRFRASVLIAVLFALAAGLVAAAGCGDTTVPTARKSRTHDGAELALSCPDAAFADAIGPMVRSWEARTGAKVTFNRGEMTPADATDLGVIPAGRLGEWAEPGHLVPLPLRFRDDPVLKWGGLLAPYADRLVGWGGQTRAVPLTGDGFVLVYRADRFRDANVGPPATWEDFAAVARSFAARDNKPSLPPLPADPERLFDFFSRVASSFDRPALGDKDMEARSGDAELLAFQFAVQTGRPRLQSPGFEKTAKWFADLHAGKCLPAGSSDDAAAALVEGRAVLAVVSLDQLDRLARRAKEPGAVPLAQFGIAGVPGAHQGSDAKGVALGASYVPHFGGGRLGVVRTRCPHPEAAFELLAELGGPARGAELIATPGLGAGPTRDDHLAPDRLLLWLGYGFDEKRSKDLQDALRHYVGQAVKNPTYGLRGPDRAALTLAAGRALQTLGTGAKPGDALATATAAWVAIDAKTPAPTLTLWRKRAAGLN